MQFKVKETQGEKNKVIQYLISDISTKKKNKLIKEHNPTDEFEFKPMPTVFTCTYNISAP